MELKIGTLLKRGDYVIEKVIGQGGFGITYLACQTGLERKVAIKEFYMKEHCNRDDGNSFVSVPSLGSKELVERFRQKFLKEARIIASFESRNIVNIIDVFEENGTAYYVMEFLEGKTLSYLVSERGILDEVIAVEYIRQIAGALSEVHSRNLLHLDIKPANIMLNNKGCAVLIDFGISKHYDENGSQTSSGLVGISDGYAPMEQYKKGGLESFSPSTDIYSLGATLYKLLTGQNPPHASDVNDEGLPVLPQEISAPVRRAIKAAMEPKRKDRPQSVGEFLSLLESTDNREQSIDNREQSADNREQSTDNREQSAKVFKVENEETRAIENETVQVAVKKNYTVAKPKKNRTAWGVALLGILIGCVLFFAFSGGDGSDYNSSYSSDGGGADHIEKSDYPVDDISEQGISTQKKVNLGLSVCWAGWNVGASSPEGYGDYYAWGETSTKSSYTESSYQYHNGSDYVNIGSNISGTRYDVARAQWGGSWRLPTKAECQELNNRCTWTWTSYNGINGYKVTGPNGNSIFLPAAGRRDGSGLDDSGSDGYYWSGSPDESYQYYAYGLHFDSGARIVSDFLFREYGLAVRPVCDK